MRAQAHLSVHTQLLSSAQSVLLSWCFTSIETAWLIRDGGKGGVGGRMGYGMRITQTHLPVHTQPLSAEALSLLYTADKTARVLRLGDVPCVYQ